MFLLQAGGHCKPSHRHSRVKKKAAHLVQEAQAEGPKKPVRGGGGIWTSWGGPRADESEAMRGLWRGQGRAARGAPRPLWKQSTERDEALSAGSGKRDGRRVPIYLREIDQIGIVWLARGRGWNLTGTMSSIFTFLIVLLTFCYCYYYYHCFGKLAESRGQSLCLDNCKNAAFTPLCR